MPPDSFPSCRFLLLRLPPVPGLVLLAGALTPAALLPQRVLLPLPGIFSPFWPSFVSMPSVWSVVQVPSQIWFSAFTYFHPFTRLFVLYRSGIGKGSREHTRWPPGGGSVPSTGRGDGFDSLVGKWRVVVGGHLSPGTCHRCLPPPLVSVLWCSVFLYNMCRLYVDL